MDNVVPEWVSLYFKNLTEKWEIFCFLQYIPIGLCFWSNFRNISQYMDCHIVAWLKSPWWFPVSLCPQAPVQKNIQYKSHCRQNWYGFSFKYSTQHLFASDHRPGMVISYKRFDLLNRENLRITEYSSQKNICDN